MTVLIEEDFSYWHAKLDGEGAAANPDNPRHGYYRSGRSCAEWRLVNGETRCLIDGKEVSAQDGAEKWHWYCDHAVTYEDYKDRLKNGHWSNEAPELLGHNRPPNENSIEALREKLDEHIQDVARLLEKPIASQETADQVSDWANRFGEIAKKAETLSKVEKAPHRQALDEIHAKWTAVIDKAALCKEKLKARLSIWIGLKEEENRKALAAAAARGIPKEEVQLAKTTAGTLKRTTAARTYKKATIEDRDALYAAIKDNVKLVECMQDIANAAARQNVALPGCKIVEERRAA